MTPDDPTQTLTLERLNQLATQQRHLNERLSAYGLSMSMDIHWVPREVFDQIPAEEHHFPQEEAPLAGEFWSKRLNPHQSVYCTEAPVQREAAEEPTEVTA